jgi:hypothetical protein
MDDTKKIEIEIRDALTEVLKRNRIDLYSDISIERNSIKFREGGEGISEGRKISEIPMHDAVLVKFTIRLLFTLPEKS